MATENLPRKMTPEEIKGTKIKEGEMLGRGAEIDETGQLIATKSQIEKARKEMENKLLYEKAMRIFPSNEHLRQTSFAINNAIESCRDEELKKYLVDVQRILNSVWEGSMDK